MADILKALFLVVTVNIFSASSTEERLTSSSSDCNCESVGPWRPVFKPSQPDPGGNDVNGYGYGVHAKSFRSDERNIDREITHVFVPVTKPGAYRLEHKVAEINQPKYSGYDTSVQDFASKGGHTVQWDHYGDVSQVHVKNSENNGNAYDDLRSPDTDGYLTNNENNNNTQHGEYENEDHGSRENENDEKFFNSDSFFEEHTESILRDTDDCSEEKFLEVSPSSEFNDENENANDDKHEGSAQEKSPPASSYASISSVYNKFANEPHPHDYKVNSTSSSQVRYPYKSIWTHYKGPAEYLPNVEHHGDHYLDYSTSNEDNNDNDLNNFHAYNNVPPNNHDRPIKQYSVHETPEEGNFEPSGLRKPLTILYSKPILNAAPSNHFWRNSERMEELRPPPRPSFPSLSTSFFYKKNPRMINHRRFNYKQSVRKPFSYVYVLKNMNTDVNKRL